MSGNVVTMNFKAPSYLKKLIEKHANSKNLSVSEYIRCSVLFDMVMDGDVDAVNYMSSCVFRDFFVVVRDALEKVSSNNKDG